MHSAYRLQAVHHRKFQMANQSSFDSSNTFFTCSLICGVSFVQQNNAFPDDQGAYEKVSTGCRS